MPLPSILSDINRVQAHMPVPPVGRIPVALRSGPTALLLLYPDDAATRQTMDLVIATHTRRAVVPCLFRMLPHSDNPLLVRIRDHLDEHYNARRYATTTTVTRTTTDVDDDNDNGNGMVCRFVPLLGYPLLLRRWNPDVIALPRPVTNVPTVQEAQDDPHRLGRMRDALCAADGGLEAEVVARLNLGALFPEGAPFPAHTVDADATVSVLRYLLGGAMQQMPGLFDCVRQLYELPAGAEDRYDSWT